MFEEGENSDGWATSSSGGSGGAGARLPQWERYAAEGTPQGGIVRSDDGGIRGRRARRGSGRVPADAHGSSAGALGLRYANVFISHTLLVTCRGSSAAPHSLSP